MGKVKKFFLSMPFLASIIVVIPSALTLLSYERVKFQRENVVFDGYDIGGFGSDFELIGNTRLFRIPSFSKQNNYQGGAFYNNYYCLAANNLEALVIYDMDSKNLYTIVTPADENPSYHCNNISFGTTFYSDNDEFPLLYVSMENTEVHYTNVYRIRRRGSSPYLTKVQTIHFPDFKTSECHLPNSYIDHKNSLIYYGGYTEKTYNQTDTNKLRFFCFDIPDAPHDMMTKYERSACANVFLTISEAKYSPCISTSSQTATQGGFISNGYLYQSYGIHEPFFRVINLDPAVSDDERVKEYDLGKMNKNNPGSFLIDEFENIGFYDGHIYAYGQQKMSIYEFNYKFNENKNY